MEDDVVYIEDMCEHHLGMVVNHVKTESDYLEFYSCGCLRFWYEVLSHSQGEMDFINIHYCSEEHKSNWRKLVRNYNAAQRQLRQCREALTECERTMQHWDPSVTSPL